MSCVFPYFILPESLEALLWRDDGPGLVSTQYVRDINNPLYKEVAWDSGHTSKASVKKVRRDTLRDSANAGNLSIWLLDSATRTGHCCFFSNSHAAPCAYLLAAALMEKPLFVKLEKIQLILPGGSSNPSRLHVQIIVIPLKTWPIFQVLFLWILW
jgi:hypothetical protein